MWILCCIRKYSGIRSFISPLFSSASQSDDRYSKRGHISKARVHAHRVVSPRSPYVWIAWTFTNLCLFDLYETPNSSRIQWSNCCSWLTQVALWIKWCQPDATLSCAEPMTLVPPIEDPKDQDFPHTSRILLTFSLIISFMLSTVEINNALHCKATNGPKLHPSLPRASFADIWMAGAFRYWPTPSFRERGGSFISDPALLRQVYTRRMRAVTVEQRDDPLVLRWLSPC